MATAGAYFCCRLNQQTTIDETGAGRVCPVKLAAGRTAMEGDLLRREPAISIGTTARVAARLIAGRMPAAMVKARRSIARKNARNKGYTPSQAHLTVMAWNLFLPNVPPTIGKTATIPKVSPLRWQIEIFQPYYDSSERLSLT